MADRFRWKKSGLFLPYFGKQWSGEAEALAIVQKWSEDILSHIRTDGDGLGLLLMGAPGRGKTLLAHIAADAVLDAEESLRPTPSRDVLLALTVQGYLDLFRREMDCMELVRKTGDEEAAAEYMQVEKTLQRIRTQIKVVLIDDIGKEHITTTGYAQNQIERMVRARGNRGLPTIITTNLSGSELAEHYGESFSSYMLQVCVPVVVGGKDFRRANGSLR